MRLPGYWMHMKNLDACTCLETYQYVEFRSSRTIPYLPAVRESFQQCNEQSRQVAWTPPRSSSLPPSSAPSTPGSYVRSQTDRLNSPSNHGNVSLFPLSSCRFVANTNIVFRTNASSYLAGFPNWLQPLITHVARKILCATLPRSFWAT